MSGPPGGQLDIIKEMPLVLPPIEMRTCVYTLANSQVQRAQHRHATIGLGGLFSSLQARAFPGRL